MTEEAHELQSIYRRRFAETADYRREVWEVLVAEFFNRWVKPEHAVLDLGCGYGEFINPLRAARKFGMDLNPDSASRLAAGITFLEQDCARPWQVEEASLDVVFTSNFLEHLPDKQAVKQTLVQARRALKPGGRFLAMGPNIRYLPGSYWDFFDHHVMLTERSLSEALETHGFSTEQAVPRFLPYTLVGGPRYPRAFLRAYLRLPWLWPLRGAQFLVVAVRS